MLDMGTTTMYRPTASVYKSVSMAQFNVAPVSPAWTNHAVVRRGSVDTKRPSVEKKIASPTAKQRLCAVSTQQMGRHRVD